MKTLKYAWRFLIRSKSYTVINLLGLAFSLACCIMLMRYIHRELTVDTHCIDREHVYGVIQDMDGNRGMATIENTNKDSIYIDHRYIEKRTSLILMEQDFVSDEASRYTVRTLVADSCYFQLFPYRIVQGTPIKSPESALLTEVCARRIFGHDNPIGKVLHYSNGKDITVSGIIAEPTCKTMIQFDIVVSNTLSSFWERMPIEFVRFTPGTSIKKMNELGKQARWVNPNWKNIDARQYTFSFHAYSRYLLGTSLCARCRLPCHAHLWKTFSYLHFILCMLIVIAYRHYKLHQSLFDRHTTEGKRVRA